MSKEELRETVLSGASGWLMVAVLFMVMIGSIAGFISAIDSDNGPTVVGSILIFVLAALCIGGCTVVNPNQAKVVTLFGVYKGSLKQPGFWWVNPLTTRRNVSLRVRNFESGKLKVNDRDGNPIEIAA